MISELKDDQKTKIDAVLGFRFQRDKHLVRPCPAEILSKALQCVVCEVETTPDVWGSCGRNGHVICKPCYTAYLKEMDGDENWIICPYLNDKALMCGERFLPWSFQEGVLPYWDCYLRHCVFTCSSSINGCTFKGSGFEKIEHEASGCKVRGNDDKMVAALDENPEKSSSNCHVGKVGITECTCMDCAFANQCNQKLNEGR